MNLSAFAHLDWTRRCLIVGAGAGMVMTLALLGAFFGSHWVPDWGLAPTEKRTLELLPFVLVGGAAFVVGVGAFGAAVVLSLKGDRAPAPRSRGGNRRRREARI